MRCGFKFSSGLNFERLVSYKQTFLKQTQRFTSRNILQEPRQDSQSIYIAQASRRRKVFTVRFPESHFRICDSSAKKSNCPCKNRSTGYNGPHGHYLWVCWSGGEEGEGRRLCGPWYPRVMCFVEKVDTSACTDKH